MKRRCAECAKFRACFDKAAEENRIAKEKRDAARKVFGDMPAAICFRERA